MTRSLLRSAVLAAVLATAAPASASDVQTPKPNAGAKVATFGIQTSTAMKPDKRGYFTFSVTPGAHVADYAAVQNYSLRPITVTLAATDAVNTSEGDFALLPNKTAPKDLGTWVALPASLRRMTIPARTFAIVPFRVTVPTDAAPGDHVGGLEVTLHSEARTKTGQRYELLQNVGARIFARVSGPVDARLHVERLRVRWHGGLLGTGRATVTYDVRNTGNVALGGTQHVRVAGLFGGRSVTGPQVKLLLPGFAVSESVEVRGLLPQGSMTARVRVDPLVVPGTPGTARPATARVRFWAVPWLLLLLVLLLLALRWYARRRRRAAAARSGRHRKAAPATATAALLALLSVALPARAGNGVPWTDPDAAGFLAFCDQHGHEVTSGKVTDHPFVWKVVSSEPAPAGYETTQSKATFYGFQPRKEHDPGEWSGQQFTASSLFSNPAHPMAQGTYGDKSMLDFVQAYPADWDGLVQVRLYFSAPDMVVHSTPYPATTVRVTGDTWTVVGTHSGSAPCGAGTATSAETLYLPKRLQPASPPPVATGPSGAAGSTLPAPGASGGRGPGDTAATGSGGSGSGGSGVPLVGLGLGALALLGGAAGGVRWWRRRAAPAGE